MIDGGLVKTDVTSRMTRRQRLTLLAAILGSAVATIDGSIVNVALPAIERDLGGGLATQQWVATGCLANRSRRPIGPSRTRSTT